jgi:hypothetical protein
LAIPAHCIREDAEWVRIARPWLHNVTPETNRALADGQRLSDAPQAEMLRAKASECDGHSVLMT